MTLKLMAKIPNVTMAAPIRFRKLGSISVVHKQHQDQIFRCVAKGIILVSKKMWQCKRFNWIYTNIRIHQTSHFIDLHSIKSEFLLLFTFLKEKFKWDFFVKNKSQKSVDVESIVVIEDQGLSWCTKPSKMWATVIQSRNSLSRTLEQLTFPLYVFRNYAPFSKF